MSSELVVYATNVGTEGGQELAVEQLILHAIDRGVKVTVVAFWATPAVVDAVEFIRVPRPAGIALFRTVGYWWASARRAPRQADSVSISIGASSARRVDAIWLHMWHADNLRRTGWFTAPTWNPLRMVTQSAERFAAWCIEARILRAGPPPMLVAVSSPQAEELARRVPAAPVGKLTNPVRTARGSTPAPSGSPTSPTVLFLGGAWAHKGLMIIGRAASEVGRRRGTNIRLLVVGRGPRAYLTRLMRLPNLSVEFVPWAAEVDGYLADADVFALASRSETFSMAGHEALAVGLPVVTTPVHGLAWAVETSRLGRVVERSVSAFADAFEEILFDGFLAGVDRHEVIDWMVEQYGRAAVERQRDRLLAQLGLLSAAPSPRTALTLTVVIPSVRRPDDLRRAIAAAKRALEYAALPQSEIVVVAQQEDLPTIATAQEEGVRVARVDRPGLAWAMRTGARASAMDIVAFTDDDAEVHQDWAARLIDWYDDPRIGGVGGRDLLDHPGGSVRQREVGTISWLGKVVGGHHLAEGGPRFVDHLKGVNCSFRRSAVLAADFQSEVYGTGAQIGNEFILALAVRQQGYRLCLDPGLLVDHHPATRLSGDERGPSRDKAIESAFNETFGFVYARHPRRLLNRLYLGLVGYPGTPGLVRLFFGAQLATVRAALHGASLGARSARRLRREGR